MDEAHCIFKIAKMSTTHRKNSLTIDQYSLAGQIQMALIIENYTFGVDIQKLEFWWIVIICFSFVVIVEFYNIPGLNPIKIKRHVTVKFNKIGINILTKFRITEKKQPQICALLKGF